MEPLLAKPLRRLLWLMLCAAVCTVAAGCGNVRELARDTESQTPERLRGLSVSYDLAKLGEEKRPVLPPPLEPRVLPPSAKPTPVTIWWQTPDGVVHQENVDTHQTAIDRTRYAGSVWLEVTPVDSTPARLATAPGDR